MNDIDRITELTPRQPVARGGIKQWADSVAQQMIARAVAAVVAQENRLIEQACVEMLYGNAGSRSAVLVVRRQSHFDSHQAQLQTSLVGLVDVDNMPAPWEHLELEPMEIAYVSMWVD